MMNMRSSQVARTRVREGSADAWARPQRNNSLFFLARGFSERQDSKKKKGAQAGRPGLAHSPLFTHTGGGDTTQPGHVANDDNPPVPPQADPAPRPHGEDVTLDPDL